jgi:hypothetical protein
MGLLSKSPIINAAGFIDKITELKSIAVQWPNSDSTRYK